MSRTEGSDTRQEGASGGTLRCSMADIVALLHSETEAHPAAAYAVGLAERFRAHLTVIGVTRDPARQLYLAQAQAQILVAAIDRARTSAHLFASEIAEAATARGVQTATLTHEMQIGQGWEEIAEFARLFDVAVLARPAGEEAARDQAMLEAVLLQAGRAVIAVPPAYAGPVSFACPMVAWDGSRSAVRAVAESMPILHRAGRARAVTVSARGIRASIRDIAPHIERHGVSCVRRDVPPAQSIAQTLLGEARDMGADLLIMGAYGHSRLREMMLGGTTRDILSFADLPVLLAY